LCDACTRANQKKKISRKSQNQVTKVAELVHIDIVGPVTPKAYDGFLWYIVFTDDLTCWRYICNMKTKGQAKDKIGQFLNMLFIQMDLRIAWVQLDNEKEFGGGPIIE